METLKFKQYRENQKSNMSNPMKVLEEEENLSIESDQEVEEPNELEEHYRFFPRTSVVSVGNPIFANEMVSDDKQGQKLIEEFRLLENKYESLLSRFQQHQMDSQNVIQEKNEEILSLNSKLNESQLLKSHSEIPAP